MRTVSGAKKMLIIKYMLEGKDGQPMSQRDIERETGLSRPFIRKVARELGHQFPRNGKELVGMICICSECGGLFRKPLSKVIRAKKQFCDSYCRSSYFRGEHHNNWIDGRSATTFSSWVTSQSQYKDFVAKVLERDGNKCVISGRTDNLQVHHILMKNEQANPEKVFDVDNAIVLCFDVHQEIHKLARDGVHYQEAIEVLKEKYADKSSEL